MSQDEVQKLREEIARLKIDNVRWRSTAMAAADEIEAHWQAHCDETGAGPVNLVRRLRGKPDIYALPYRAIAKMLEGPDE